MGTVGTKSVLYTDEQRIAKYKDTLAVIRDAQRSISTLTRYLELVIHNEFGIDKMKTHLDNIHALHIDITDMEVSLSKLISLS